MLTKKGASSVFIDGIIGTDVLDHGRADIRTVRGPQLTAVVGAIVNHPLVAIGCDEEELAVADDHPILCTTTPTRHTITWSERKGKR